MIEYDLDTEHSIVHVRPKSAIEQDDFTKLANAVDPLIEATGDLAGLIIEASGFPGWESFGALVNHFRFVRDHHKHVGTQPGRVADSGSSRRVWTQLTQPAPHPARVAQ